MTTLETITFDAWERAVRNKYVDVDGWYGGQCWDAFASQCLRVFGIQPINTFGGQWSGWAYAIWDQYEVNGAAEHFEKIPATAKARENDVAIWRPSAFYPYSHIAPVIADAGNNLYCLSQNSSRARPDLPGYHPDATGPCVRQYLTKDGLAGYIRFRTTAPAGTTIKPITAREEDPMPKSKYVGTTKDQALPKGHWKTLRVNDRGDVSFLDGSRARRTMNELGFVVKGLPKGAELHVRLIVADYRKGRATKVYRYHRYKEIIGTGGATVGQLFTLSNLPDSSRYRLRVQAVTYSDGVIIDSIGIDSYYWKD